MIALSVLSKKHKNHLKAKDEKNIKNSKALKRKHSDLKKNEVKKIKSLNITNKEIINYIKVLYKLVENDEKTKKSLFNLEKPPIFLIINCVKIPKVPLHQMRM
jgi:hypothetical protein